MILLGTRSGSRSTDHAGAPIKVTGLPAIPTIRHAGRLGLQDVIAQSLARQSRLLCFAKPKGSNCPLENKQLLPFSFGARHCVFRSAKAKGSNSPLENRAVTAFYLCLSLIRGQFGYLKHQKINASENTIQPLVV